MPRPTYTRCFDPLPAPKRNSPHAAALLSFSMVSGSPIFGSSSSFSRMPSMARRFGEQITLFSWARTKPGTATHAPPTSSCPSFTSETVPAMFSTRCRGELGVG